MIRHLQRWWNRRRRAIDIDLLWPSCVKYGRDIDHAKAAFLLHTQNDEAWSDLTEAEIVHIIDALPAAAT